MVEKIYSVEIGTCYTYGLACLFVYLFILLLENSCKTFANTPVNVRVCLKVEVTVRGRINILFCLL